jgi:hypothetical protein
MKHEYYEGPEALKRFPLQKVYAGLSALYFVGACDLGRCPRLVYVAPLALE